MAATRLLGKTLGDLLPGLTGPQAAITATGLALDSRWVRAGDLFFAYPGETSDGRDFVAQAVSAGAAAIAIEPGLPLPALPIPVVEVRDLRAQISAIADRFFDHPSQALTVIGVTGTNGKTSVTQLLGQALRLLGRRCGVIGTLGNSLDGRVSGGGLTTPDPIGLQQQLADWRDQQVRYVAMEVSSHGLAQKRVGGVTFSGAVFTNLTRDHLDFHGTMANYGAAKAALFDAQGVQFAVISSDDAFGLELAQQQRSKLKVLDFSIAGPAAICVRDIQYSLTGVRAQLTTPWGAIAARSSLLGDFNLSNLLAVVGVLGELGIGADDIEKIIPRLQPIAGRMERVGSAVVHGVVNDNAEMRSDIEVVVDYAHTPDALEHALIALRRHCQGRLWCVFGCGGDRDRGKRPLMGAIAARLADVCILTSDNPRSENPAAILAEIQQGIARADDASALDDSVQVEIDRATAIARAVTAARAGDLVLIAGKGHEDYQVIGGERFPFSDMAVARAAVQQRSPA